MTKRRATRRLPVKPALMSHKSKQENDMRYSEVIAKGLIQPAKDRYTMRDVHRVQTDSLTAPVDGRTLSEQEARFIVKCSAIHHGTDYSCAVAIGISHARTFGR